MSDVELILIAIVAMVALATWRYIARKVYHARHEQAFDELCRIAISLLEPAAAGSLGGVERLQACARELHKYIHRGNPIYGDISSVLEFGITKLVQSAPFALNAWRAEVEGAPNLIQVVNSLCNYLRQYHRYRMVIPANHWPSIAREHGHSFDEVVLELERAFTELLDQAEADQAARSYIDHLLSSPEYEAVHAAASLRFHANRSRT